MFWGRRSRSCDLRPAFLSAYVARDTELSLDRIEKMSLRDGESEQGGATVEDTLEKILKEVKSLRVRVESLETTTQRQSGLGPTWGGPGDAGDAIGPSFIHTREPTTDSNPFGANVSPSAATASVDAEYQRIRCSVQSVRLPANLTLQESRQGVKREDLPLFNVLAKCARYTETMMKLCASADGDSHENVFNVSYAMMKYIQDEYTALIVSSTFDPNVSRVFRSLQRNTGFTPEAMEHLRSATTIASAYRPQTNARARGRGGRQHSFQNQGLFQTSGSRGFPRRGGSNANSTSQPSQNTEN